MAMSVSGCVAAVLICVTVAAVSQATDWPDSVLVVNGLKDSGNVTFTAKNANNASIVYSNLTTLVTVAGEQVSMLHLPPTGPAAQPLIWSVKARVQQYPTPATVTGPDFIVEFQRIRMIRLVQYSDDDTFRVLTNQSVTVKNSKPPPKVDTAIVLAINDADNSTSSLSLPLYFNTTSDNCYKCLSWAADGDQGLVLHNYGMYLRVDTNFGTTFDVFSPNGTRSSRAEEFPYNDGRVQQQFQEKAEYILMCHGIPHSSSNIVCQAYLTKTGVETFGPLWRAALALFIIGVAISVVLVLNRRYQLWLRLQCRTHDRLVNADLGDTDDLRAYNRGTQADQDSNVEGGNTGEALRTQRSPMSEAPATPPRAKKTTKRLRSLDTFRGLSLSIMIFVNYEGGRYWFFNHSRWNGLTVADCVFPWFIWIMGTSMVISFNSLRRKGMSRMAMALKVIRRSVILFCIGLFLNNGYDLSHWRIPGVLQRFGVSYLVVGLVDIFVPSLNVNKVSPVYDIIAFAPQWFVMIALLIVHTAITFGMYVPGCPTGYLGPGGIGDEYRHPNCTGGASGYLDHLLFGRNHMYRHPTGYLGPGGIGDYFKYPNCTAGAAGYLDQLLFGNDHIYHGPTCLTTYKCNPYDPEGALGSLTSIFLCFLGCQAGRILVIYEQNVARITRWIVWGCILGAIGTGLCEASQNTGIIPINKNLWSMSFIFVLGAGAFLLLTLCYILVDVMEVWSGAPFYFPGMNSILVYVGSELLQDYFPFSFKVSSDHSGILASSLVGVSAWLVIAFYCHHIKFYLKI